MTTPKTRSPLFTIFLTIFIDMLGVGIAIPVLAIIILNPQNEILPTLYPESTRNIILGFLTASYPLAQFFGAPILGALADHYGRKKILLISIFGTILGYILFAIGIITGMLPLLFISRFLDGFTGGNISIIQSSIADISDQKSKAKNFGLIGMAFGLGFILGPFIGGKLSDPQLLSWFSYSTPFWFAATLALINLILVSLFFKETLKEKTTSKINLFAGILNIRKAFQMHNLQALFLTSFLLTFGFSFFTQFFQVFLIQKFSFDQSQIGNTFAYIGLWVAIAQGLIVRPLSKKFRPQQILSFSIILLSIALFCILIPEKAGALLLVIPFVAIFNGLTQPNLTSLISNATDPKSQGEILGVNQSMASLGQAIPPIIAGFIVSIDKNLPIFVAGMISFTAWLVIMLLFSKKQKETFKNENN